MNLALAMVLLIVFSGFCFAQDNAIEKDFEKNKSKYTREKLSEGEDASSGSDYLVYKDGTKIVKIRSIWSSSAGPVPTVEDFYFADGKLVLWTKSTLQKKLLKSAVKGKTSRLSSKKSSG